MAGRMRTGSPMEDTTMSWAGVLKKAMGTTVEVPPAGWLGIEEVATEFGLSVEQTRHWLKLALRIGAVEARLLRVNQSGAKTMFYKLATKAKK